MNRILTLLLIAFSTPHAFGASAPRVFPDGVKTHNVGFPSTPMLSADPNTLDDYKEGTWTPTVFPGSGAITAYAINIARYTKVGRMVFYTASVTITTKGTGAGDMIVSTPTTPAYETTAACRNATTGVSCSAIVTTSGSIVISRYDNATIMADGNRIIFAGSYEQ